MRNKLVLLLLGAGLFLTTCYKPIDLRQADIDTTFEYLVRAYEIQDTTYYFQGPKVIGYEVKN